MIATVKNEITSCCSLTLTARDRCQPTGALHLLVVDIPVIKVTVGPVEAPVAAALKIRRQARTSCTVADTTVLLAPARAVLVAAAGIVGPDAAAGRQDDNVVGADIPAGRADVDGLHNHLLACSLAGRPCELVALAAVAAGHLDGEAIGQIVGDGHGRIRVA